MSHVDLSGENSFFNPLHAISKSRGTLEGRSITVADPMAETPLSLLICRSAGTATPCMKAATLDPGLLTHEQGPLDESKSRLQLLLRIASIFEDEKIYKLNLLQKLTTEKAFLEARDEALLEQVVAQEMGPLIDDEWGPATALLGKNPAETFWENLSLKEQQHITSVEQELSLSHTLWDELFNNLLIQLRQGTTPHKWAPLVDSLLKEALEKKDERANVVSSTLSHYLSIGNPSFLEAVVMPLPSDFLKITSAAPEPPTSPTTQEPPSLLPEQAQAQELIRRATNATSSTERLSCKEALDTTSSFYQQMIKRSQKEIATTDEAIQKIQENLCQLNFKKRRPLILMQLKHLSHRALSLLEETPLLFDEDMNSRKKIFKAQSEALKQALLLAPSTEEHLRKLLHLPDTTPIEKSLKETYVASLSRLLSAMHIRQAVYAHRMFEGALKGELIERTEGGAIREHMTSPDEAMHYTLSHHILPQMEWACSFSKRALALFELPEDSKHLSKEDSKRLLKLNQPGLSRRVLAASQSTLKSVSALSSVLKMVSNVGSLHGIAPHRLMQWLGEALDLTH